ALFSRSVRERMDDAVHGARVQPDRDQRAEDLHVFLARREPALPLRRFRRARPRSAGFDALAPRCQPADRPDELQDALPFALLPRFVFVGGAANDFMDAYAAASEFFSEAADLPHGGVGRRQRPKNGVLTQFDALGDFDFALTRQKCEAANLSEVRSGR